MSNPMLGIIGGGQLGSLLAIAAEKLNIKKNLENWRNKQSNSVKKKPK